MAAVINKENGSVSIDNEVIKRVAGIAAMDCFGIVGMAAKSVRDDVFRLLKLETLTKGVKLEIGENVLSIQLHIIVEYGTPIPAIANALISNVKYKVEEIVGLTVANIEIYVEGIRVTNGG